MLIKVNNSGFLLSNSQTSKDELKTLKGIGDAKAKAIIAARPFKSADEIKKIKGISDKIYNVIKDKISVK